MIYESSQKLVKKIESRVCDAPDGQNAFIDFFQRELFFPFRLLGKGFYIWYRGVGKFSILFILLLIFWAWFSIQMQGVQKSELVLQPLLWVTIFVPAGLSMFSSPSSYCFYGADRKLVDDISHFLNAEINSSSSQAKAICEIIKLFEKRVDVRIVMFRGLLALAWGFILYSFNIAIPICL